MNALNALDFKEDTPVAELRVAAESISSFTQNGVAALGQVAGKLQSFLGSIASNFASVKTVGEIQDLKGLAAEEQKFLQLIEHASYAEVRQFRANVPEGFSGDMLNYANALAYSAGQLTNVASEVLQPYTVFLAQLMGTANAGQLTQDRKSVYLRMNKEREAAEKAIGAFFKTGRKEAELRVGDVVARNADFAPLFQQLRKAQDAINAVDRVQLSQLVAQAEDYLNVLCGMLESGKLANITAETSRALADGAYEVASHLEYYASIHFRVLVLTQAVKDTVERVNKILG
jgi:hypothetical protein